LATINAIKGEYYRIAASMQNNGTKFLKENYINIGSSRSSAKEGSAYDLTLAIGILRFQSDKSESIEK